MFRKLTICFLIVFVGLTACTKKKEKPEDAEAQVQIQFANPPLPPFSQLLAALDYLKIADYEKALPKSFDKVEADVHKSAFELGKLTADAVIAVKSHNKKTLLDISKQMIDYSKLIGISENILKLTDEIRTIIEKEEWDNLEVELDKYKRQVEISLYDTEEYDLFALLRIGGWTEGLNRMCFLLNDNFQQDKTDILDQKGTLNNVVSNLGYIQNPDVLTAPYYQVAKNNYQKIEEIISKRQGNNFSKEEIQNLYSLTEEIKNAFK